MNNNFTIDPETIWAMKKAGKAVPARLASSLKRTKPGTPIETWRIVRAEREELLSICSQGDSALQGGRPESEKSGSVSTSKSIFSSERETKSTSSGAVLSIVARRTDG